MDKFIGHNDSDSEEEEFHTLGSDREFFSTGKRLDSDDDLSDEETQVKAKSNLKKLTFDAFDLQEEDEDEEVAESEENEEVEQQKPKSEDQENINELFRKSKLLKLKNKKPKGKTGVVYLSKIPPYMKPAKMRQILTRFGEVDRLFLKKEAQVKHKQRVKQGGNKKQCYDEGWAEFYRKKDAKMCAATLNGNTLGGKKGSYYYDDVMNIKYLSGFKWSDLTEQISRENEVRQSKLQMEISQAQKLNKAFISNVERSKMIANIEKKKKSREPKGDNEEKEETVRRTFEQRRVTTTRADGPQSLKQKNNDKLESVLSSVF